MFNSKRSGGMNWDIHYPLWIYVCGITIQHLLYDQLASEMLYEVCSLVIHVLIVKEYSFRGLPFPISSTSKFIQLGNSFKDWIDYPTVFSTLEIVSYSIDGSPFSKNDIFSAKLISLFDQDSAAKSSEGIRSTTFGYQNRVDKHADDFRYGLLDCILDLQHDI